MINVHKLENGDIIKILPILSYDNKVSWCTKTQIAIIPSGHFIYDNSDKNYLKRISDTQRFQLNVPRPIQVITGYYFNIYIDGEVRIMTVSKTLYEKIISDKNLLQLKDNYHLHIVKERVTGEDALGGYQGYSNYGKSFTEQIDWNPPVNDIESKEEWIDFIKSNTFDHGATKSMYDTYIENNNIFNKKQELIDHLGIDLLSNIIIDDRDKKLNKLEI